MPYTSLTPAKYAAQIAQQQPSHEPTLSDLLRVADFLGVEASELLRLRRETE